MRASVCMASDISPEQCGSEKGLNKRQLNAMADMFRDDAPKDPRARLQLIMGDKSD